MKRLTVNFREELTRGLSDSQVDRVIKEAKESGRVVLLDTRNSIYCLDPTMDIECYKNYIDYLNAHYNEWRSYGYMDMGLVPITLEPSFLKSWWEGTRYKLPMLLNCPVYSLRAVSFLNNGYVGSTKDSWVRRCDLAVSLGVPEEKATLSTLLERLGSVE